MKTRKGEGSSSSNGNSVYVKESETSVELITRFSTVNYDVTKCRCLHADFFVFVTFAIRMHYKKSQQVFFPQSYATCNVADTK